MTALGRLWRRAPVWRRALYLTATATTLAVLFPPPPIAPYLGVVAVVPKEPGTVAAPVAVPALAQSVPQPGMTYSDRLPFGTQSVPLPVGRWLALVRQTGDTPNGPALSVFLALELGGRVVAVASITGSFADNPKEAGYPAPLEAQIPNFYYRRVYASVDHGPVDLWIAGVTTTAKWNDQYRQAAIGAIQHRAMVVPGQFDTVVYRLADRRNWLSAEFMFTDATRDTAPVRPWTDVALLPDTSNVSYIEKVRRWGKAWHGVMKRGFAGGAWSPDEAQIPLP